MAHASFIHGVGNKPKETELLRIWRDKLKTGGGLNLGAYGISPSMIYWAHIGYLDPDPNISGYESLGVTASPVGKYRTVNELIADADSVEEANFIKELAGEIGIKPAEFDDSYQAPEHEVDENYEGWATDAGLKILARLGLLQDVSNYLFNKKCPHSSDPNCRVRDTIRKLFVDELKMHEPNVPVVVIAHSMGTVIAYDCLKNVSDCPSVAGFVTAGSPLGIGGIRDRVQPNSSSADNYFPSDKVNGGWVNIYDLRDPVVGIAPKIADNFKKNNREIIQDLHSGGAWGHLGRVGYRNFKYHDMNRYLKSSPMRNNLKSLLQL